MSHRAPRQAAAGGAAARTQTVIASHLNLDFDALASLLAVQALYPGALLVLPDTQEQNVREYLTLSGLKRRFTPVNRVQPEQVARLVLVDTRQRRRLGKLAVLAEAGIPVDIYDHHPPAADDFAGTTAVLDQVGATATLVLEARERRGLALSADEATLLMLGIYEDTGSLTFASTTPRDLAAASRLLEHGANLDLVRNFIHQPLSGAQRELFNRLLAARRTQMINGVPVSFAVGRSDSYIGDVAVIAHRLRDLDNLPVLFVIVEMEQRVHIVARSSNPAVPVGELLAPHGGGGHATAASLCLTGMTATEAEELVRELLAERVAARLCAADIMNAPVRAVRETLSISEAKRLLLQLDCSGLVVTAADGTLQGIITHRDIDKALAHEFTHAPVKAYMTAKVVTVAPDDSIHELQEKMLRERVGRLPVVADGQVRGIVTRSDLMHALFGGGAAWRRLETPRATVTPLPAAEIRRLLHKDYGVALFARLAEAGEEARALGMQAYLVGGMVRDLILGERNLDIDIVVAGNGMALGARLGERWGVRVSCHERFLTAKLQTPEGAAVDVATARVEHYAAPAALPVVEEAGDIVNDLKRRDFSVNAAAIALNPDRIGEVIDPHYGYTDLQNRVLRVLHPHSFIDDPSRILRAQLFISRFALTPDAATERALQAAVQQRMLQSISPTRLRPELLALLDLRDPRPALRRMHEAGILAQLHARFAYAEMTATACDRIHHPGPAFDWPADAPRRRLYLLALLLPLEKKERREWLRAWGFSQYDMTLGAAAARWRDDLALLQAAAPVSQLDRGLAAADPLHLSFLHLLADDDGTRQRERCARRRRCRATRGSCWWRRGCRRGRGGGRCSRRRVRSGSTVNWRMTTRCASGCTRRQLRTAARRSILPSIIDQGRQHAHTGYRRGGLHRLAYR